MITKYKSLKNQCINHNNSAKIDTDGHLNSRENYEPWLNLKEAAEVRDHAPILEIAENADEMQLVKATGQ